MSTDQNESTKGSSSDGVPDSMSVKQGRGLSYEPGPSEITL